MHVVVIGAGAFGGWSALFLQRQRLRVTLIDAWGPGHSRASSGGETRIIRAIYGDDLVSTHMAARSLVLWKEHEERWKTRLYLRTGVVFLSGANDAYLESSKKILSAEGIEFEEFSRVEAARRYPQFNLDDIDSVLLEPESGVLFARRNCQTVVEHFLAEGGEYRQAQVQSFDGEALRLNDGSTLRADAYVFACGPWLGKLFPDLLGELIVPTRQEVLFVGPPAGEAMFDAPGMPCWADRTSTLKYYGIPNVEQRGFKLASDMRGASFDPENENRIVPETTWIDAQTYLRHRFPRLTGMPLVETRVCQYENSPDLGLIVDRHPQVSNVWVAGGGSGHGYKHGPAVGEYVAALISETAKPIADLELARFRRERATPLRRSTI